jgi:hypothetical protein
MKQENDEPEQEDVLSFMCHLLSPMPTKLGLKKRAVPNTRYLFVRAAAKLRGYSSSHRMPLAIRSPLDLRSVALLWTLRDICPFFGLVRLSIGSCAYQKDPPHEGCSSSPQNADWSLITPKPLETGWSYEILASPSDETAFNQ